MNKPKIEDYWNLHDDPNFGAGYITDLEAWGDDLQKQVDELKEFIEAIAPYRNASTALKADELLKAKSDA